MWIANKIISPILQFSSTLQTNMRFSTVQEIDYSWLQKQRIYSPDYAMEVGSLSSWVFTEDDLSSLWTPIPRTREGKSLLKCWGSKVPRAHVETWEWVGTKENIRIKYLCKFWKHDWLNLWHSTVYQRNGWQESLGFGPAIEKILTSSLLCSEFRRGGNSSN